MTTLTLVSANKIIEASLRFAVDLELKPLSVAVLDSGGHLKAFQKQDGASLLRFEIAFGKAFGALAVGAGSRWLDKTATGRPHFIEGLSGISSGKIVPVPGGVLIKSASGELLGAVGITGDSSDNDEAAAVFAIEEAGFQAQVD
ncbi:heme-binding protein [Mesorhizobium sp. M1A.F.Ca.IN.020.06.1.1]|uniref:GlcG/HbpS family heme-binding protein n=1 Tax=unclassified Mesorhizobium TaxID=325217 RepID=UPI000FCBB381|nr:MULTISPECIES: heme-binding protein [unclassified Mesorhizobium]RUV82516.1 heme-binding protein [Mesorhizobium sp. M1A.F.Ca.IN.020.32.1.1]RUW06862.1 heme-binding protein [Mesorhizobium sp. M1A.F.Ca.IN.022.05.2.1]RUW30628.1 heme-binding protein [Mesorhizobium sp. M1A.F.Ca.IN.020.06.1.1]RWF85011.1 MAG: heme-binding protein [Mesorhizobium sp.]RWG07064.1 MAG: heme-binding protein [Mesorhizobium sp.]